jgi:hypothetical protein
VAMPSGTRSTSLELYVGRLDKRHIADLFSSSRLLSSGYGFFHLLPCLCRLPEPPGSTPAGHSPLSLGETCLNPRSKLIL